MVRDLFEGEEMARVMSLVFMVFMLVPMLAPNIGQAILLFADWRAIFLVLAGYGAIMWLWSASKLPETLHPEYRRGLHAGEIWRGVKLAATDRLSIGYTLALTAVFGGLTAYIASIQQIVFDVFAAGRWIGLIFAAVAAPMAVASWGNSRVVGRFGLRRTGHCGLLAFVFITVLHALIAELTHQPLWLFVLLMALSFGAFAFTTSNFGTLAMANMAPIAGTASSFQGVTGTIGGATLGLLIGQSFDGTQLPFLIGMATCGLAGLALVLWTERGQLFAAIERRELSPVMPEDLG
jgi:DHA1 family bicyclomycin/chloramphenicol resistance-like MFS transporter